MNKINEFEYLNKELNKVKKLFFEKKYEQVLIKSKKIIKKFNKAIPFYNFIGLALIEQKKYNEAHEFFSSTAINNNEPSILANLALINKIKKNYTEAEKYYKMVISMEPNQFYNYINYANLKKDLKDYNQVIDLLKKALNLNQNIPEIYIKLAETYKSLGNFDSAKEYCHQLNIKFPMMIIADEILSKMIDYSLDDSHQKLMINKLKYLKLNSDQITINFALAKSYEDQKNFKNSLAHLKIANDLKLHTYDNFNFNDEVKKFEVIKNCYLKLKKLLNFNDIDDHKNIIFIVGLPRSGTTLLHQIISNKENIFGAGELVFFNKYISDLANKHQDKDLIEISTNIKKDFNKLITDINFKEKFIVEKTPDNFLWLGILKLIFPKAKIIHISRNIKDNIFSLYKHNFEQNSYIWSYNDDHLITYVNRYLDMMDFWKSELKDQIYNINYEELVLNPQASIKEVFDFCGLEFESDVFNYSNSKTPIDTLSSVQSRKPIYSNSLNFYKNYENLTDLFKKYDETKKKPH